MLFHLLDTWRAAEPLRRHGAMAALAGLVMAGFTALTVIGVTDRWRDEARAEHAADTAARAELERDRQILDRLATAGMTSADEPTQRLLDQIPTLTPGVRAAALYDPTGMLSLRTAGGPEQALLAQLGAEAAKQAAARPGVTTLATTPVRDGSDAPPVGLARPWLDSEGKIGGLALIALDDPAAQRLGALTADGDKPAVPAFRQWQSAWPFAVVSIVGVAGALSLIALLVARGRAAESELAARAAIERELRDRLAAVADTVERSDRLSRAKSQFFAQATHELRTPLNAILGFAEAIRHEMFGPVTNPRYVEYAGLIQDAGSHLLSLINDLLDTSRIEAGKMDMSPVRMSPAALARSAFDLVELLAKDAGIELASSGAGACPDIYVDPRAMKQVLVNLLSNAIKYTLPGGRIDLRFAARDDGGVAIEIADTGIGMSADDLRVVFEPFGRATAIEARSRQGTGLGLSLARSLVRLHGGDLTLASQPGAGTTATVTLPPSAAFGSAATATPRAEMDANPAQAA